MMTPSSRWDPVREAFSLRDAMSQLFEQAVMRPGFGTLGTTTGSAFGHMNVLEANGSYYCQVILPGVDANDVELTVRQNTLTLMAKVPEYFGEELRRQGTYLLQEIGAGEFSRSVAFPKDVQADAIAARYDRGILSIEIPIAEHAQPKRIQIQADPSGSQPTTAYVEGGKADTAGQQHDPAQLESATTNSHRE